MGQSEESVRFNQDEDSHIDTRTRTILFSLAILSFIISLESAILVPVLPSIAVALRGSTSSTLWAGSSYLLTAAVFQPLIGSLTEEFGHKSLLLITITLFTIGVFLCCLSHQMPQFLIGRSMQGIGGGGILALANTIPTAIVSLRQRPIALMLNQVGFAIGTILGPILGGIIGQFTTWRWIFYINFPLCGLVLPVVIFVMKPTSNKSRTSTRSWKEQLRRLDYIGAILFLGSTCSLLLGIIWGGEQYPWRSWQTLLPIFCGIFGLAAALLWEAYGARAPFLCLSPFSLGPANAIFAGTFSQGFLLFCQLYYLPVYFEGVRGFSMSRVGLTYLPITSAMIVASLGSGVLMRKTTQSLRWIIITGWTFAVVSTGLLFIFDKTTATYTWVIIFLLVGLGHGMLMISLNYALQVVVNEREADHTMSMYTFLRTVGMCIGIAVGSSLLQNALNSHLPPGSGSSTALMDMTDLSAHPDLPPALLVSFRYTCGIMTGASIVGLILSIIYASVEGFQFQKLDES